MKRYAIVRQLTRVFAGVLLLGVVAGSLVAQDRPLVVIDPGHGGADNGVELDGWLEKDLILEMSFVIGAEFAAAGWDVAYTRTRDHGVEWADRRSIAEEAGADLLLMLHANANEDLSRHGAEIYLNGDDATHSSLAEHLSDALQEAGSAVLVDPRPWPFLRSETVPTAMIELAFMTHPEDQRLLKTSEFHHKLGSALASGAAAFLHSN